MKFTLLFSLLFIIQQNFAQKQIDSISITDYQSDCVEIVYEKYTVVKDSTAFVYKNENNDLWIGYYDSTESDKNIVIDRWFIYNKITIKSIYRIITDSYTPREKNHLFLYGIDDLSNLLKENQNGKYRLIELLIGVDSDNPVGMHLLLYSENAKISNELKDFIQNSKVICLIYNHTQI